MTTSIPLWREYPPELTGAVVQADYNKEVAFVFDNKRDAYSVMTQIRIMQSKLRKDSGTPPALKTACSRIRWTVIQDGQSFILKGWDRGQEKPIQDLGQNLDSMDENWLDKIEKLDTST